MNRAIAILAFATAATSTALTALAVTPTLIIDREGLAVIADNLAGTYELGADIDLGGTDWTPIGNDSTPFTGSFHGNGHTISEIGRASCRERVYSGV